MIVEESFLKKYVELLPGHAYVKDINGIYLACNQAQAKFLRLPSNHDIVGKTDYDLLWRYHANKIRDTDNQVISTGRESIVEENIFLNGKLHTFISKKAPIRNDEGKIIGVIGTSIDLTDVRIREEKIISLFPGHFYWKDLHGAYLGGNAELLKFLGLNVINDLIGKKDTELSWHQYSEQWANTDLEVVRTGKTIISEEEICTVGNDQPKIFLSKKAPLYKGKEIVGIIGTRIDITEQRNQEIQIQVATRVSRAKSEFIANMSHDLRTPITGILGLAQSLQVNAENPNQRQDADLLIETVQELLNLLNEIMEVVNLDAGHTEERIETFSIKALVAHNIALLQSAAKHKGIKLSYKIASTVPDCVSGNRLYLDRSLLNLLSNAIKFTHQGSVSVSVSLMNHKDNFANIRFAVNDTGIGIPADKFEDIFDHFSRLTASYQGIYKGTGLGLYTVKQYVKAMNGQISVQSQEEQGSVFTMEIPLAVVNQIIKPIRIPKSPEIIKHAMQIGQVANPVATVLVVEDNLLAARMARQVLVQANCASQWAETGNAALELLKKETLDFVLMDIGLPDIDGIELAKQIRHHHDLPIIALTGHLGVNKKQEALAAGINHVIVKPIYIDIIQDLLKRYVFINTRPILTINEPNAEWTLFKTIDLEEGTRLVGGNLQSANELLKIFMDTLPGELEHIDAIYMTGDFKQLSLAVHKFYGGLCYCGVPRLRAITKQLYALLAENRHAEVNTCFLNFRQEILALIQAYPVSST